MMLQKRRSDAAAATTVVAVWCAGGLNDYHGLRKTIKINASTTHKHTHTHTHTHTRAHTYRHTSFNQPPGGRCCSSVAPPQINIPAIKKDHLSNPNPNPNPNAASKPIRCPRTILPAAATLPHSAMATISAHHALAAEQM